MALSRRTKWLLAVLFVPTAAFLLTTAVRAACDKPAAYGLYASSYMDSLLNPSSGEDTEFFTRAGGVPNIFFLLDSSSSMRRLPPNGPGFLPGGTMQNGVLVTSHPTGVVGCGLDSRSDDLDVSGPGTPMDAIRDRTFSTPCGETKTQTASSPLGRRYQPDGVEVDYADEASACPYLQPGNNNYAFDDGWDPEFYTVTGNSPKFFERTHVFHDTVVDPATVEGTTPATAIADGWTDLAPNPFRIVNSPASVAQFCAVLPNAASTQGGETVANICNTCLTTRGFFFDGRRLEATQDQVQTRFPSVWYTGNYLNFYPPKFLMARKVVKDVIATQRKIRMAMAKFGSNGAAAINNNTQSFNPTCDHPDSSFDANRSTYVNALNGVQFDGGTPLSMALFNIGQFYRTPSLPWFGGKCSPNNAGCAATGWDSSSNKNTYSICYSCQTSSVIVVTDGVPSPSDGSPKAGDNSWRHLPVGSVTKTVSDSGLYAGDPSTGIIPTAAGGGVSVDDCPECGVFTSASDYKNNLARVAWYLHNMDFRQNSEETRDCKLNGGKQVLDVYTVGFATSGLADPDARTILANAAKVGGGVFVGAESATQLRDGLFSIFKDINERSTSFSVATVSTLQSQSGHSVVVPRFDPAKTSFWKGHLFRYDLKSEFVSGCTPNAGGDLNCDGKCDGAFLIDNDKNYIQEDGNGRFVKNEPDLPSCNQSKCSSCGIPGNVPAKAWWDAGAALRQQTWRARKAYTVVDNTNDGRVDAIDEVFLINRAVDEDAYAQRLVPYMNVAGGETCRAFVSRLRTAGDHDVSDAIDAGLVAAPRDYKPCVKHMVRYLLGADVFNEKGRRAPDWPVSDPNLIPDRDYKLGDIFHSSPVVVTAPLDPNGVLCQNGLANQCLVSLWVTEMKNEVTGPYGSAYEEYAKSGEFALRRRAVVVGANDGFVHAFDGGAWVPDADDPSTDGLDESVPPFNGYYAKGTGSELWAFMPPDLLSKVHLLFGSAHQFYVDGTPMVRDVWVDGTSNGLAPATALDDVKQSQEFHTVAVIGERRGGRHYFALDITGATKLPNESGFQGPRFLWIYPQPNEAGVLDSGETYSDFLPGPPPIGPVRVKADANSGRAPIDGVTPSYVDSASSTVRFREKWIAFLSGGFDPQYARGRGVHMVDVWTGREMFDFSRSACTGAGDPRCALNYPVPATVGMVAWEKEAKLIKGFANGGYFDTATFGDAGGQLWVLRFNDPGALDASGKASNWLGARVFQMGKQGTGAASFCRTQPFFNITANVDLPEDGTYRVHAGTGDRFNLLDDEGGQCGPDNVRACLQRGCEVTVDRTSNLTLVSDVTQIPQGGLSGSECEAPVFDVAPASPTACTVEARARIAISACPSPVTSQSPSATTKDIQVSCVQSGTDGYSCDYRAATVPEPGTILALRDDQNNVTVARCGPGASNWFFSVRVFELTGSRQIFTTDAQAQSYDAARLGETDLANIDGALANPTAGLADAASNGWAIRYNHSGTTTINEVAYTVDARNERTSAPTTAAGRFVTWNTTQRTSASSSTSGGRCDVSKCTQEDRRVHYTYCADVTTGGSCFREGPSDALVRAYASAALVPPPAAQFTAFVNQRGQVMVGLTRINTETGAQNMSVGTAQDPASSLQWLEVTRDLHSCRHAPSSGPAPALPVCR